jgi:nitronate monooxygenase
MSFGSGGSSKSKAWKDIWGCGQGIGAVKSVQTTQALVERLSREYSEAKRSVA